MSNKRFTRGEWVIKPLEDDKEYIRIRGSALGGRFKIANVIDLKNHHNDSAWCKMEREESLANAHLIALAPMLYEKLNEISIRLLDSGISGSSNLIVEIEKLLAKARGEQ